MHDHGKNGGGNGMLWMMIPCLLLLGVLFLGGGKLSGGGYLWPALIGGFVLLHVLMMFRGHGHGGTNTEDKIDDASAKKPSEKDEHKHGGCCH